MDSLTCLSEMGSLIMLMKMNYVDQCCKIFTKVLFLKNNLINKYPTSAAVIVLKKEGSTPSSATTFSHYIFHALHRFAQNKFVQGMRTLESN